MRERYKFVRRPPARVFRAPIDNYVVVVVESKPKVVLLVVNLPLFGVKTKKSLSETEKLFLVLALQ